VALDCPEETLFREKLQLDEGAIYVGTQRIITT